MSESILALAFAVIGIITVLLLGLPPLLTGCAVAKSRFNPLSRAVGLYEQYIDYWIDLSFKYEQ